MQALYSGTHKPILHDPSRGTGETDPRLCPQRSTTLYLRARGATGRSHMTCLPRHHHQGSLSFLKHRQRLPATEGYIWCATSSRPSTSIRAVELLGWRAPAGSTLHFINQTSRSWSNLVESFNLITRRIHPHATFRSVR